MALTFKDTVKAADEMLCKECGCVALGGVDKDGLCVYCMEELGMKDEDKRIIYEAIVRHGDSFWNDNAGGNKTLVDELDIMLMKDGYELVVRKVGQR